MAFNDVREYISALEEQGELKRVKKEVNWDLEAGAITRLTNERNLPSPFFEKIKGYSSDFRILGSPMSNYRKLAIAMGRSPETPVSELTQIYQESKVNLIKPVLVNKDKAPCKQNIDTGDQIDLLKFPAPMIHEGDGGRYLCTWHINVSKDHDTGHVNWGMYRFMVVDKESLVGGVRPSAHMGQHFYRGYKQLDKPMPTAIAINPDPLSAFAASAKVSIDISEAELAGGLRQKPAELVKCETVDLEVPASSEIVIEGEISLTETALEGPFGEYTGYQPMPLHRPVFKVTAITYRDNPILPLACPGIPVDEGNLNMAFIRTPEIYQKLKMEGIPLVAVNCPVECCGSLCIVSVKAKEANIPNLADQVASVIWGTPAGANSIPYIFVVEDDVDVFNMGEVLHALVTKCHPWRNIRRVEHGTTSPLQPFLSAYERKNRLGSKAYFDCTWPLDWDPKTVPQKVSFKTTYPKELQDNIMKNWEDYGFDKLD